MVQWLSLALLTATLVVQQVMLEVNFVKFGDQLLMLVCQWPLDDNSVCVCLHRPLNVTTLSFLLFFNYICLFIYVNALVVINLLNTVLSVFRVCLCAYWLDILKSYLNQFLSIAMLNFAINYHFDYDRQSHTYTFIWHRNQLIQFNIQFLLLHSALFFAIYCY